MNGVVLQRKHEGVERDLAALEDKVATLDGEAARLAAIHADHAPAIHTKRDEITRAWQKLVHKAQVPDYPLHKAAPPQYATCITKNETDVFSLLLWLST